MRIPVVDGDCGWVNEYGFATSRRGAMRVARRTFADPVVDAYIANDVILVDGRVLPEVWVVVTKAEPA